MNPTPTAIEKLREEFEKETGHTFKYLQTNGPHSFHYYVGWLETRLLCEGGMSDEMQNKVRDYYESPTHQEADIGEGEECEHYWVDHSFTMYRCSKCNEYKHKPGFSDELQKSQTI